MADDTIRKLSSLIRSRRGALEDRSYTRQLLDGGVERCAKKFGEEAIELVIATLGGDDVAAKNEAADVVYHLLVLLEARGIAFDQVLAALDQRMGLSGLDEKAQRQGKASE